MKVCLTYVTTGQLDLTKCSIVFNFWEPLHYLTRGYGFQTWETSPLYAIRSWAYILLHMLPTKIVFTLLGPEKVCPLLSTCFSSANLYSGRPSLLSE